MPDPVSHETGFLIGFIRAIRQFALFHVFQNLSFFKFNQRPDQSEPLPIGHGLHGAQPLEACSPDNTEKHGFCLVVFMMPQHDFANAQTLRLFFEKLETALTGRLLNRKMTVSGVIRHFHSFHANGHFEIFGEFLRKELIFIRSLAPQAVVHMKDMQVKMPIDPDLVKQVKQAYRVRTAGNRHQQRIFFFNQVITLHGSQKSFNRFIHFFIKSKHVNTPFWLYSKK
ncbi:MAG: hypothetical protein UV78_C0039G0003 [Parcubacteria group bacterium GW2011_GWA2_43_17]|nr:MAG: hypothetical protein UV78_C0039G0003 [Parcubacteria group bacterium GW2011_GWA2_43_17]